VSNIEGNHKSLREGTLYAFAGFTLDTAAGLLSHSGEPVKLAPKVYQLLVHLVENRDRIVSKDELFTAVWQGAFVEDNALSFTVSQLRKSLAAYESETTFVQTVPRRGFRFVAEVGQPSAIAARGEQIIERRTVEEVWVEEIVTEPAAQAANAQPRQLSGGTQTYANRYVAIALLTVLIAVSVGAFVFLERSSSAVQARSVAVIPLEDLSGTGIDRSILLGMTYALISQLGRSDELAVRPLSSTVAASAADADPIAIGKRLGVDSVVEWNLQRIDGQFRVNARLIQVADGRQLWSESFSYSETDLFKVQDAVSDRTARALIANISPAGSKELHKRPTENNDAYQAYLRGRYHWNQRNLEGFNTALGFFEQAISLDPKFADAHAGLADVYLGLYDYGYRPASETIPNALAAVNRSLQLNPGLSDSYSTLASIEFLHNLNWQATEQNFRKAIELAPNDPTPKLRFGWMLSVAGRVNEGLEQLLAAERLDPTSSIVQANIAYNFIVSGRNAEAQTRLLELKRTTSKFSLTHWYLGTVYYLQGRSEESLAEYFTAYSIDEGDSQQVAKIREMIGKGDREQAFRIWREDLEARYARQYFPPSNIALVAAFAKDRDNTVKWLLEAERVRDPWILQVLHDPEYGFLKGDPEFGEITAKLRFK
jgi:DNA-binding winged helix-turn-helix (wHTH) protein/TolB-like protein